MMKRLLFTLAVVFTFTVLFSPFVFAADSDKIISEAYDLYKKEKYEEARKLYEEALKANPDLPDLNFNTGAARFKTGEYDLAGGSFEKGMVSQDKALESRSSYNLANTKYKIAKSLINTDASGAEKLMLESLGYYKRAIDLNTRDDDAKFNYELVDKELKELKERQQQQQGQCQTPKDKSNQERQQNQQQEGQKQQEQSEQEQEKQESKEQKEEAPETSGQPQDVKEMSAEQAKMLLEGYRQEENQQGRLQDTRKGRQQEVSKDW